MQKVFIPSTVILFFFISCKSTLDKIKEKETKLWSDSSDYRMDTAVAKQIIELYGKFVNENPDDSLAPEYLFKQAEVSRALKNFDISIVIWQTICEKYPTYIKAPHSLFLQAFVYENDLKNIEKAREKYTLFLEKYPSHDLSDDVKFSLQNLGKNPEDIIKSFEQQQDSSAVAGK